MQGDFDQDFLLNNAMAFLNNLNNNNITEFESIPFKGYFIKDKFNCLNIYDKIYSIKCTFEKKCFEEFLKIKAH